MYIWRVCIWGLYICFIRHPLTFYPTHKQIVLFFWFVFLLFFFVWKSIKIKSSLLLVGFCSLKCKNKNSNNMCCVLCSCPEVNNFFMTEYFASYGFNIHNIKYCRKHSPCQRHIVIILIPYSKYTCQHQYDTTK